MKVIFLDVDGVLNNTVTQETSPEGYKGVDEELVNRLKRIISVTGAKVVLTSTWKYSNDKDLKYLYKKLGDEAKPVDETHDPYGKCVYRGAGIKAFLMSNKKVKNFVILDDYDFDFSLHDLQMHHIWTDPDLGLTDENVERAIGVLKGDLLSEEEYYDREGTFVWGYHK